ncbi:MAG: glutamate formimidoyltransferase [Defluviitaleaceae bacterium]|nr:glutamate formimidoyltransferase [Defluviitaleaceae bacterium]
MTKIVKCIPNFSVGRDEGIIEGLAAVVRGTAGCTLLDYSADASHNRSVFTFVGDVDGAIEAAVALAKFAVENIDMTQHSGEHPRMGAVDVIPFVPVKGVSMDECVELSRQVGERIAAELLVPVILYEESAANEKRKNLAAVRRGEFEGMAEKLAKDLWKPDFGPCAPHPTAGVVAVGARQELIAFNVNLSTNNAEIANNIAKALRGSSGGMKFVKGIGLYIEERDMAQVSMNLVNYPVNALYRVVEMIRFEAARYGVSIIGTELIGLAPMKALIDSAEYYLQIENFDFEKQVLENHLL